MVMRCMICGNSNRALVDAHIPDFAIKYVCVSYKISHLPILGAYRAYGLHKTVVRNLSMFESPELLQVVAKNYGKHHFLVVKSFPT